MKKTTTAKCTVAAALLVLLLSVMGAAQDDFVMSPYRVTGETGTAHIFPTVQYHQQIQAQLGAVGFSGPLLYHGGPIMKGPIAYYAIFWVPPTLQDGTPTSLSAKYESLAKQFLADYGGHGIANNSTQYFYTVSGVNHYFVDGASLGGAFVDTDAYPPAGCVDSAVHAPNCITDAQLQAELTKVMTLKGWKAALNHMFLVFTSQGEGSCFDSSSTQCAYTLYCAYHNFFGATATPTIYANQPFADPRFCFLSGTQKDPNGDIPADANVSVASHEMTEANTDPELNAWFDASGNEIGDLCNFNFGTNTWDGGLANQFWNGHNYEVQQEFDNHTGSCVQVGP